MRFLFHLFTITLTLGIYLSTPLITERIMSLECKPGFTYQDKAELEQIKILCEKKVGELRNQANTLSSQIQFMDTQIYLTSLRIEDTEQKIETSENEVELLDKRIDGLDESLNHLSKLLVERIVDGYKSQSISFFNIFLDSDNANDLLNRVKYQKTTRENNQKLLVQVQESKLNYESQKKTREDKIVELDKLTALLSTQKQELDSQKVQKQQLLTATRSDETVYQNLVEKARQELRGFTAFTTAAGGAGLTSFGSGSNGWYYTQRDPAWGNYLLPGSSSSVALAGCAMTSVAMVCKSYGQDMTPTTMVNSPNKFIGGDLWNWAFNCDGKSQSWISASQDGVKSYVQQNKPVILRLVAPSVSGLHFVVAWKWDEGSQDFIIHDPYYGPDKKFSERYDWSQVTTGVVIQ
jgi:peptidoglycan hydrolase CwlO-like protein